MLFVEIYRIAGLDAAEVFVEPVLTAPIEDPSPNGVAPAAMWRRVSTEPPARFGRESRAKFLKRRDLV